MLSLTGLKSTGGPLSSIPSPSPVESSSFPLIEFPFKRCMRITALAAPRNFRLALNLCEAQSKAIWRCHQTKDGWKRRSSTDTNALSRDTVIERHVEAVRVSPRGTIPVIPSSCAPSLPLLQAFSPFVLLHLFHCASQIAFLQQVVAGEDPRVLQGPCRVQALVGVHDQKPLDQILGLGAHMVPHGRMELEVPALNFSTEKREKARGKKRDESMAVVSRV